ncbi:putative dipeptidyl-aminopeptidase B [Cryoendolithus antarcticus]|uniref:dipeptidyl-peptidase IV n=1 Tax=Cryoendolithus antarcticus TaxID=1507870 RepID=A0A1V8SYM7_9PEZI|nr:putative dipeptidyl-aminopeptidase B [Cryoendolithus antarcticus]
MEMQHQVFFEQSQPLAEHDEEDERRQSASSASTMSMVLEHVSDKAAREALYRDHPGPEHELDMEDQLAWKRSVKPADKKARRVFYILIAIGIVGWLAALGLFIGQERHVSRASRPHDPHATNTVGSGKKVTLQQVLEGKWYARSHAIRWIAGPAGEDGLLLERGGQEGRDYLVVEDVRYREQTIEVQKEHSSTLMKAATFKVGENTVYPSETWPSADHKKVLVQSDYEKLYRHSSFGRYWIFDVESQRGEPLDPANIHGRVQSASWSPTGDAVVFTRDNNMYIRHLDSDVVQAITTDGGPNLFYGVPDWVYEEEVFAGSSVTWWAGDGKYVAFLRTDESKVPVFPVQYFFSRPSGKKPAPGEEKYPETSEIKYPKAGAPMSVVTLQIYDVEKGEVFEVPIDGDFEDDNRLITEVLWAGKTGKLIVRSTNRESDILKLILIDAVKRTGNIARERDVQKLDGGWMEVSETTTFIPNNANSESRKDYARSQDGYIDTVIHNGFDHLAYFTPLDNPEPRMLTEGNWEVVKAPSGVDLKNNLVYFIATRADSMERHVYSVDINAGSSSIKDVTDQNEIGYYGASFSDGAGFMLLSYQGPKVPWQKVKATPGNYLDLTDITIEENKALATLAQETELPIEIYKTYNVEGFDLNVVERRPPHFDDSGKKKYPVLFYLYNGPGFQEVDRRFTINFQSYVASTLGYIVVTVDGRGTGFLGREHRCIIRGNMGYWEAHDQIAVAKMFKQMKYVDPEKLAIWGWSYGGFMTLKTLETDAGETFKYGMAVAPVTDWRFYDSVYTERYMHTPQHNPEGYDNATISNMTALGQNAKFLVMHGYSDDNVHFQNTLQLLDRLDQANVRNYDVHVFPDSDHSIYFHNANAVVYEKLSDWLVNAFNGEWLRTENPTPMALDG